MSAAAIDYADSLAFVRRYRTTIARIARRHGECADDLAQDIHIYYSAWMKKHNPRRGKVTTHIFNQMSWHLRSRRRKEFRHVTCELNEEICQPIAISFIDDGQQPRDLRDAPLPLGLPSVVRETLAAACGCETTKDLAAMLGITDRGARKRIARCERLAVVREPVQFDFFTDFEGAF